MTSESEVTTEVRAEAKSMANLILSGTFTVPWHQRRYDWDQSHIQELLEDLREAVEANRSSYFLGTMMLVERKNQPFEVNDGQQRIITTSLMCANMLRTFEQNGDQANVTRAIRILFNRTDMQSSNLYDADAYTPRFVPSISDRQKYNQMIRGHDVGSNGKLTSAWETIDKFFSAMSLAEIGRFIDFIAERLEIACLYVPESVDANSVFESLNARGKPLSDLDKIRNHIYSFFGETGEQARRVTVNDNLECIITQLKTAKSENRVEEYVRAFSQTQYGFLPKASLYREVKRNIGVKVAGLDASQAARYVHDTVSEMSRGELIQTFKSIVNPNLNPELFESFKRDSRPRTNSLRERATKRNLHEFLNELKNYKVVQSLVFAILGQYILAQSANRRGVATWAWEQLDILTSFVMRTSYAAAKFEPSRVERDFAELARCITTAADPTLVSITETLRTKCDDFGIFDEAVFKDAVKQRSIRETSKARRFLLALAHYEQRELSIVNDSLYSLEHVLPKSEEHLAGWSAFDATLHAEYNARLGNFAILAEGDNRSGSRYNRNFEAKKTVFSESAIKLTSSISENSSWDSEAIERRQERLSELAADVWKLPSA